MPGPRAAPLKGADEGLTRLWLLKPDRTLATLIDKFIDFEMDLEFLLTGTIKVKIPADHRMFGLSWNGIGILDHGLENWGCSFYYRDPGTGNNKKFIGIADPLKLSHHGQRGSAYAEVEFNHAFWDLMKRREVWTEDGARYELEDTPDNIARDIIAKQCMAGSVVTPIGNFTDRTQFGHAAAPWSVTVDPVLPNGQHPERFKYSCDHGTALPAALQDLFVGRMPRTGASTDIYPAFSEPSPGDFRISILCGKDVVSPRVIGRNLVSRASSTANEPATVLAPERSTMLGYSKGWERTDQMTSIEVKGKGQHREQLRFFIHDPEMVERVGPIENAWTAPEALDPDELEFEARTYLAHRKEGTVSTQVGLIEREGRLTYPTNIDLMDTITVYSGKDTFGITEQLDVLKVTVKIPVPGKPHVEIGLGQLERNWLSEMGRHGGGRGGGGGGGGRPRSKGGGVNACTTGISCIQDSDSEDCVDKCEAKLKFLGDAWISAKERRPAPGDHGPGATDLVVKLDWCAPECLDAGAVGPVIAMVQLCVRKADGSQMTVAVAGYKCAAGPPPDLPPTTASGPPLHP